MFSSAKFFNEYIRIVKGSDVKFDPFIRDKLCFPQNISYKAVPDIPFIPSFMLSKLIFTIIGIRKILI